MKTMKELLAERTALVTRMKTEQDTTDDEAWKALVAEKDDLEAQIDKRALLDEADRYTLAAEPAETKEQDFETACREYSIRAAILHMCGDGSGDVGREREVSDEIAKRTGKTYEGMAVPIEALSTRAASGMTTTKPTGGTGGTLVDTVMRTDMYQDLLRDALVVRQAGATVLSGLRGDIKIPAAKSGVTGAWVAEDAALSTENLSWESYTIQPKHAGVITQLGRQLLQQSSIDVEMLVRRDFAAALADLLDTAALNGATGGNSPVGILNTTGVDEVTTGTNGSKLDLALASQLVYGFEDDNLGGPVTLVTTPEVFRLAAQTLKTAAIAGYLAENNRILGTPTLRTNNMPKNGAKGSLSAGHSIIAGLWSNLILAYWSDIDLMANPYADGAFERGAIQVRAMIDVNTAVRRPKAFQKIESLISA